MQSGEVEKAFREIAVLSRRADGLRKINEMAVALPGVDTIPQAQEYISKQLKEIAGALLVGFSEYDPSSNSVTIVRVCTYPGHLQTIERYLGEPMLGAVASLQEFPSDNVIAVKAARLPGVRELFFGRLDEEAANELTQELGVGEVYGLALHHRDELIGTMPVMMPRGAPPLDVDVLEVFANVAGAGLWQKSLDAELQAVRDSLEARVTERSAELARRNEELEGANRRLERLVRAKDEFVAMVNHELRTPLVTGIGYLELLDGGTVGALSGAGAKGVRVALKNLRNLARLIDNILQYQSLEQQSGFPDFAKGSFDLAAVIRDSIEEVARRPSMDRLKPVVELPDGLGPVFGNADMIQRVIVNLLDNARRHAGDCTTLRITAEEDERNGIRVTIEDDGQGMIEEVRKQAMLPFFRADDSHGGTGLGLAVVSGLCAAHGSEVELRSAPGEGTAASFRLPLAEARC